MNASNPQDDLLSIDRRWRHAASRGPTLHFVGEQGLLLDPERQKLYALNACATVVWCSLKEGKSPTDASRLLVEQFALPPDVAWSYVADVLHQYDALSAADEGPAKTEVRLPSNASYRGEARVVEIYSLLDSAIRVRYDSIRLFEAVHPLVRHRALTTGMEPANVVDLGVMSDDDGVIVVAGDEVIGATRAVEEAAVAVRACLTQLAVERSGGLCAIHAGALCRDGFALLLPGEAGSGKSTLSAALAAAGFEMLSDDTTLLCGMPPLVRSVPTGLCIKRGSCTALEPFYRQIRSLPERHRPDGKQVRYLMPDSDLSWAASEAAVAVRWIVFPRYHPDSNTGLLPLSRHESLARLLHGVYFLSGSLSAANLDRLIAWIEGIDCFELPLSSLDEATAQIEGLCR